MIETTQSDMTTKKAFLVMGVVLTLVAISLFPARWFGVTPHNKNTSSGDLRALLAVSSQQGSLPQEEGLSEITWKTIIEKAVPQEVIEEAKTRKVSEQDLRELNDPNNLTSTFAKGALIASFAVQEEGDTSESDQEGIIKDLILQEKEKITHTRYTSKDSMITPKESTQSIKEYGNTLAKYTAPLLSLQSYTIVRGGIEEYAKTKDKEIIIEIQQEHARVEGILTQVLSLKVPPSAILHHTTLLNTLSLYEKSLEAFSSLDSDPLKASLYIDSYTKSLTALFSFPFTMKTYFTVQGVTFSSQDPGYFFLKGYTTK